ncbi:cell death regulator Aven [Pungitius pungitius]|uniref:cell death regulator Aven n=1 Tax=Pungitius pungitius TaxID=134920 RepID=UPI002E165AEA
MDTRPSAVRGGSWRRGGRGGSNSETAGGEHRGRGRGGYHRGRGKRDHYRGRGRGGSGPPADFQHRDEGEDEGDNFQEEVDRKEVFSKRKLASNWDRYEASEKQEPDDEDTPAQRGTDYHLLLESAGDCFTQFRFSEEKEWEMDSSASPMSAVFVDLPALAEILQQVPLHQRLNLEAELLQISTPLELPSVTLPVKQETAKTATFTLPSAALKIASSSNPPVSSSAAEPPVDDDEELDQLLSLQKPVWDESGSQSVSVADESAVPKRVCERVQEDVLVLTEEKMDEVKNNDVNPPESASVRPEMTEEDLEDWLDSMIS